MARNGGHGRPPFPTGLCGDATQTHQLGCLKIASYKRKLILKITRNTASWVGFFSWLLINPSAYWLKMSPSASCRDTGNGQDPDGAPRTRGYVSSDLAACLLPGCATAAGPFSFARRMGTVLVSNSAAKCLRKASVCFCFQIPMLLQLGTKKMAWR